MLLWPRPEDIKTKAEDLGILPRIERELERI